MISAISISEIVQAFIVARQGDTETATQLNRQATAALIEIVPENNLWGQIEVALESADIDYCVGNVEKSLEAIPTLLPPEEDSGHTHLNSLLRLEQIRFRARALLETNRSQQVEEGHHLLHIFQQEVSQLPPGLIRTSLTPAHAEK